MRLKRASQLVFLVILVLPGSILHAATIGAYPSLAEEYRFNTEASPNEKHNTHDHGTPNSEYDDGSGGDNWDLNFLGFDIDRSGGTSRFRFGAVGGSILSGQNSHYGTDLYLGDLAINVLQADEAGYVDPTINTEKSAGWDYAVRLLGIDDRGDARFELFEQDDDSWWRGANIYGRDANGSEGHVTNTFQLVDGRSLGTFNGSYTDHGGDKNFLEGSFDLGLLSLFDEKTGGRIITYLTMSCVNDEAIVHAQVSAVPIPSAVWLFGSALLGFIAIGRRTRI